jgi:hypothetical protein
MTEEEKILQAFRDRFGPFETYRNHQAWKMVLASFTAGWKAAKGQREDGSADRRVRRSLDDGSQPPNPRGKE